MNMRKAYVAASSQEPYITEAEELISWLSDRGWDVYDWPAQVRAVAGLHVPESELAAAAREEYDWIRQCSLFVLLASPLHSGALVEYGISLASDAQRIVVRPSQATIFGHLSVGVETVEEAKKWILR